MRGRSAKQEAESGKLKAIVLRGCWLFVLSAFVVGACVFVGCQPREDSQINFASPAEKKAYLLRQLGKKFENPGVHFELGRLYQAEGEFDRAEYHYNVALGFDPAYRVVQAVMVKMLVDNGNAVDAQEYVDAYMSQASGSAMASLQLARAFANEGLDEYALAGYEQALRLGPDLPEVNKQVGYYYLGKADEDRAKEYLTRSFRLNPNQADVAGELGRLGVVVEVPQEPEEDVEKKSDRSAG